MSTLNMDALKKRLQALKASNKKSNLLWKPTEKEQTIRIVPYKHQPDNPFIELYFHYDLNGKTYISPVSFGKPDPIMEVAQELKNSGDKESWKMGKDLEPKLRTFAPVIVRGKEGEGVKFWGFGKTVYETLLSNIADESCGDISHPTEGRDVVVWAEKEEGKKFLTPKIRIKMSRSKVISDDAEDRQDLLNKIAEEQPDITEIWELKSYEELQEALNKHLNPEEEDAGSNGKTEEKSETETKSPEPAATETKAEPVTVKDGDINEAFNNIFNKQ